MQKSKRKRIAVYPFNKHTRRLLIVLGGIVILFGLSQLAPLLVNLTAGQPILLEGFAILITLIVSIVIGYGTHRWLSSEIRLYNDGIAHVFAGEETHISWEDLSHFGTQQQEHGHILGIYAHSSEDHDNVERFIALTDYVDIPKKQRIPPVIDLTALRETEFGQQVYNHAPHLFEEDAQIILQYKAKNDLGYVHDTKIHNDALWQDEDKMTTTTKHKS